MHPNMSEVRFLVSADAAVPLDAELEVVLSDGAKVMVPVYVHARQ